MRAAAELQAIFGVSDDRVFESGDAAWCVTEQGELVHIRQFVDVVVVQAGHQRAKSGRSIREAVCA